MRKHIKPIRPMTFYFFYVCRRVRHPLFNDILCDKKVNMVKLHLPWLAILVTFLDSRYDKVNCSFNFNHLMCQVKCKLPKIIGIPITKKSIKKRISLEKK